MLETPFDVEGDYYVPLLKILDEFPNGISKREVRVLFWQRFENRIPAEHLLSVPSDPGLEKWANKVDWARNRLRQYGYVDSPALGMWRITQSGRKWLVDNPAATHIKANPQPRSSSVQSTRRRGRQVTKPPTSIAPAGITLEMLEQTRRMIPPDQFRQIWGAIYDELIAKERAKAITSLSDRGLADRARKPIHRLQDFLQGRGNDAPKSEEVCDWIHLCYALELYREAAALWQYVSQADINPWQYERTKKVAAVSRTKVGV